MWRSTETAGRVMVRNVLKPGTVIRERYIIECVAGAGGFGITYRARDPILDVTVAIKEYKESPERFLREARIMARFRACRNIAYIYDFFEEYGTAYIVMEFLEGETLKERIERTGCIPSGEAVRILVNVLKALDAVHRAGMIHRDVAPDNIYLLKNGQVKLFDFGNAEERNGNDRGLAAVKSGYSPPEQYDRTLLQGPESDIYAAGATLYRMLTARIPLPAAERSENSYLRFPVNGKNTVGRRLKKIVCKAMCPVPTGRYQSAQQFRRDLEKCSSTKGMAWVMPLIVCLMTVIFIGMTRKGITEKEDETITESQVLRAEVDTEKLEPSREVVTESQSQSAEIIKETQTSGDVACVRESKTAISTESETAIGTESETVICTEPETESTEETTTVSATEADNEHKTVVIETSAAIKETQQEEGIYLIPDLE